MPLPRLLKPGRGECPDQKSHPGFLRQQWKCSPHPFRVPYLSNYIQKRCLPRLIGSDGLHNRESSSAACIASLDRTAVVAMKQVVNSGCNALDSAKVQNDSLWQEAPTSSSFFT